MFIRLSMAFKAPSEQVAGCFPYQLPCAQLLCVSDGPLTVYSLPWGQLLPPLGWWLPYHGTSPPPYTDHQFSSYSRCIL